MREFKFRAWDKSLSRFIYCRIDEAGPTVAAVAQPSYPLLWQQFTGYKDINGKDVFEGDLVAWPEGHELEDHDPMQVVFEFGVFAIDGSAIWDYAKYVKTDKAYSDPTNEFEELEVVGNIHESK